MDGRKLWDWGGALLPLLGQTSRADKEVLSDPPKITDDGCSRSGTWNQLCHSPINAWPRNHTVTGFSLRLFSCDYVQLKLCQSQVDSQVSQLIWEEQEKWQKLKHMESSSASNQVWHRESIMGSRSFLAPFTVNWGILKERWFLESQCGQQGWKTPSGETRARRFAQMPVLPHSNGRRDRHPPERERENCIYHKENENTTESIQISYLDNFLSLQREQKMRFKHQLIYRLIGKPTLFWQNPFSSSMAENFTDAMWTLRSRQNSSTGTRYSSADSCKELFSIQPQLLSPKITVWFWEKKTIWKAIPAWTETTHGWDLLW